MSAKVFEGCLWNLELRSLLAHGLGTLNLVRKTFGCAAEIRLNVRASLDDIARDVECVARSLRDSQPVVKGDAAWYSA